MSARRFTKRQRVALYLAADGRCEESGEQLLNGFHADHIVPFSKGGPTDVINGAALSPTANLRKGPTMRVPLRQWQAEALDVWEHELDQSTFVAHACTATGKTGFAAAVIESERRAHPGTFTIVVVPRAQLRSQWADEIDGFISVELDPTFDNGNADPRPEVSGIVVTYQAVNSLPDRYRRLCRRRLLVVLDEAHHCGEADHLAWGPSISSAFELAARRLLLTATPLRGDGAPLSFVKYEGEPPTAHANYSYPYWMGLRDRIVRPIEFRFFDGHARWVDAGEVIESGLSEVNEDDEGIALSSAINPGSEWVEAVLPEAAAQLDIVRRSIPDAAGLIIAKDQQGHAQALAGRMGQIIGQRVPVVVSDDPKAHKAIEAFAKGRQPWLVAVNMVSEGVDIPRLIILVYATWVRAETPWRQAMGRVIRTRSDGYAKFNRLAAMVFLPNVPTFVNLARELEKEQEIVFRERGEGSQGNDERGPVNSRQPLAADDGWFEGSVMSGEAYSAAETEEAAELAEQCGIVGSPAQLAQFLRSQRAHKTDEAHTSQRPKWRDRKRLEEDCIKLVRARGQANGGSKEAFRAVWNDLFSKSGVWSLDQATDEVVRQWIQWLS